MSLSASAMTERVSTKEMASANHTGLTLNSAASKESTANWPTAIRRYVSTGNANARQNGSKSTHRSKMPGAMTGIWTTSICDASTRALTNASAAQQAHCARMRITVSGNAMPTKCAFLANACLSISKNAKVKRAECCARIINACC